MFISVSGIYSRSLLFFKIVRVTYTANGSWINVLNIFMHHSVASQQTNKNEIELFLMENIFLHEKNLLEENYFI